jgi:hypothetical protein
VISPLVSGLPLLTRGMCSARVDFLRTYTKEFPSSVKKKKKKERKKGTLMKFTHFIGSRIHDLPVCSIMP